uniref:Uncharacterized protein n=1 Tax=Setaria italica TaxID=4555 RepID=K4AKY2_SETIT
EELEDSDSSAHEPETTTSGCQSKKKWGQRGRNQYPEGQWRVDVVSLVGEPIEPPLVRSVFHNAIGTIIRTKEILDSLISNWLFVPEGRKVEMRKHLKQTFILPKSKELKKCGELNDKYVKKSLTPFNEYGSITQAQWDEFVSQKNRELVVSNIHKLCLGPSGYREKIDKWWQDREAAIVVGQTDPYECLDEHGWQWLQAREPTIVDGKCTFSQPETNQVILSISTRCMLHIPVGRASKTKEVAKGLAILVGSLYEGKPIACLYACRYSKLHTNIEYNVIIGVDDIPYLLDCAKKFEYGKPLLPDSQSYWFQVKCKRLHSWYIRACRLGLRTIWARYSSDVFGPPFDDEANLIFDFQDIHDMFCLSELELELVKLWCMMQENDVHVVKENPGYLDPYAICKVKNNFPSKWRENHDKLAKYYVREHIRVHERYTTDPRRTRPQLHSSCLHEKQLLNIGTDLCRFILHEVVNPLGTFYHPEHELAQDDEWENPLYHRG